MENETDPHAALFSVVQLVQLDIVNSTVVTPISASGIGWAQKHEIWLMLKYDAFGVSFSAPIYG